jgi:TRAP-type transport system periplasmic protein
MKQLLVFLSIAAVLVFAGSPQAADYPKMTIRAATANPDGSLHVLAIDKFKEIVEKESNGAITVQTFYGGSMGDEQANVKQLRNAEINIAVLACGNLTPFAPAAGVFYLPYLFPSLNDAEKLFSDQSFMDNIGNKIAAESRTRPLAWLIGGYRVITNSKKPIEKMADLQGLKIRVPPVELQLAAFRSWGVEPHPLAWSETFNGLQQGVIDGQENPHAINRDQKFWEVQKYVTNVHYLLWVGPILVSETWYRKLTPQTKELVDRAAKEAAHFEWKWSAEQESIALKACRDKGMVVNDLTDEPAWMEAARSIWPNYYDKVGGKALVDQALQIMKK